MARLIVLSSAALADGFRLAGAATVVAQGGPDAARALERLLHDEPDVGLALVTSDLWSSLGERLRTTAERLGRPIVLPIPAGDVTDPATRRQVLGEMLQRAIGYRIEIGAGPAGLGRPGRSG
jgi:vacuolar-type H+-ATPase subunit F/Vma7